MTKFEFIRPHIEWDPNSFFEAQGLTVYTRVRSSRGRPWSVVVNETLSAPQRATVANELKNAGATKVRFEAKPTFAGAPAQKAEELAQWQDKAPVG